MSWIVWAVASVVTFALSNIYQRKHMKNTGSDAYATTVFFQFGCALLFAVLAIAQGVEITVPWRFVPNLLLLSAAYGLGMLFIFKALKSLDTADANVIFSLRAPVTMLGGMLILGEVMSLREIVGGVLFLIAVYIAQVSGKRHSVAHGFVPALMSAFCFGVAMINDAYLLNNWDIPLAGYNVVAFGLPGIFLLLSRPKCAGNIKKIIRDAPVMLAVVLLYALAAFCFGSALRAGAQISVLGPFSQASVVLTALLGAWLLGERRRLSYKLTAAGVVIFAASLIS